MKKYIYLYLNIILYHALVHILLFKLGLVITEVKSQTILKYMISNHTDFLFKTEQQIENSTKRSAFVDLQPGYLQGDVLIFCGILGRWYADVFVISRDVSGQGCLYLFSRDKNSIWDSVCEIPLSIPDTISSSLLRIKVSAVLLGNSE